MLAVAERVGQLRIEPAAARHRARHVLAGIAVAVERHLGRRAQALAEPLVVARTCPAPSSRRSGSSSRRRCARTASGRCPPAKRPEAPPKLPPNRFSKKPPGAAIGVLAILRSAIVLAERDQHAAALPLALAAVALQALDLDQGAIEVRPHLLDLVVERAALRRLSAEQREEAAALAAHTVRLLAQPIELGLLLGRRILVALDLLGPGRIERCAAAIDAGELAFEPQAGLAARRRTLRRAETRAVPLPAPPNSTSMGTPRPSGARSFAITVPIMERSPTRSSRPAMEAPQW